jgi:PAS domain S-box-containing protein
MLPGDPLEDRKVTTRRQVTRGNLAVAVWLLVTWAAVGTSAAAPKRVAILDSYGRDVAPYNAIAAAFRSALPRELGEAVDLYQMSLELAWSVPPDGDNPQVETLRRRFEVLPADLVVPVGAPAVRFAARYRERIFPGTPVLFTAADPRLMQTEPSPINTAVVTQRISLPGIIEDILQMQPSTRNIVVIFGGSPLERFWARECRREFGAFAGRVSFTWLVELPLEEVLKRCAALPPDSFVFLGMYVADVTGIPYDNDEALRRLHAVANAPIFGIHTGQFGLGTVGGRIYQEQEVGFRAARAAARILRGEKAQSIPPEIFGSGPPVYDWRELQKWGISEERLPAGSTIRFRRPTIWQQYRWRIVAVALLTVLQMALIVGLIINLSRRRRAEVAMAASGELNRATFEQAAVGIAHVGTDGRWLRVNDKLCSITGYPRDELLKLTFQDITHPDDLAKDLKHVSQILEGKIKTYSTEKRYLRKDGSQVWVALTVSLVRTAEGEPNHFISVVQDIAERKRAEEALRASEARLDLAADAAGAGLWSLALGAEPHWVTRRARELFGFSPDEKVTARRVLRRIHPEDKERVRQALREGVTNGGESEVEFRVVGPDGNVRWLSSRGHVTRSASGEPASLMGSVVDVTPRREAEEARRSLSRRLIQAQDEERSRVARELHDDVTQRLALLAIDAGGIEAGPVGEAQAVAIQSVRQGLAELSDDVRALSHRLHPSGLELVGLAGALKAECERFSSSESLRTDVMLEGVPAGLPPETALCLLRVAQEAMRNSARHARGRTVEVRLQPKDEGLQLVVRDDGVGFDPAAQRSRPTLGLASMRERMLLADGELRIESAPGQGTTIVAWVPLKQSSP